MKEKPWYRHYDDHIDPDLPIPPLLVSDIITANSQPEQVALDYLGTQITFGELDKLVQRMANVFDQLGVKKGDPIGLHLPNIPQYVISYYAAMSLGAIVVNFNPMYTSHELISLIRQTGLKILITFEGVLPVVEKVCQEVKIPFIIATGVSDFLADTPATSSVGLGLRKGWLHFSELLDKATETAPPRVKIHPGDPAMIQFTGGTTGVPKGAVLTHANIISAIIGCSQWGQPVTQMTPPGERVAICVMPLFHVLANVNCMGWSMFNCARLVLIPRFELESFMDMLETFEKITFLPTVPTMINAMINHPKAKQIKLDKRLDLLNSGGGPMPVDLVEKIKENGIYYVEGWGMSETTAIGIGNPVMGLKKNGSIGIPLPGLDIRLMDLETGKTQVAQGEPGELVVKGTFVMKEYWNSPEKTASELKDGWLYTGDIAVMDEDGYLFIVDRKKDMIIAGGYNIYPREIDEVLHQHPKVAEAISIGVPHEYRGETVKAYLVLEPGQTATQEEIIEFCKERLAAYKIPKLIEFRDDLPKSAVGKTLRNVLRQQEADKRV
ncbi:MAG: long-chain fatty acid--CoA ligase [Desulfobacula sp.]|nr:long-chain fatty acid--CoA ligase [Desulfobacula sp.]